MTFFALLLSHLLGDFVFQPTTLVMWKQKSWKGIFIHAAIHLALNFLFFLFFLRDAGVLAILTGIVFLHFWIDYAKIHLERKSRHLVTYFFVDQLFHIGVIVIATWLLNFRIEVEPGFKMAFLLFFILAVFSTYCVEIIRFQFERRKEREPKLVLNIPEMLIRFAIMCITFLAVLITLVHSYVP